MAAAVSYPRFLPSGDAALIVEFGADVDKALNDKVLALTQVLEADPPEGLIECVPTFRSLMVHLDPLISSPNAFEAHIAPLLNDLGGAAAPGPVWRVPACYEGDLAPDLEEVASATNLSAREVIDLHSGAVFQAYMLGFLPGFAYFGGLPEALQLPRRTDPRTRVPAGSVAIAQSLSAIYPVVSPGGWHLIGNTPIRLFDPDRNPPTQFATGDRLRFVPVGRKEFDAIAKAVAAGEYVVDQEAG